MKELKGTKTEKNLWEAFAGESQARNKYTFYASQAKKDGYEQMAAIFEETAIPVDRGPECLSHRVFCSEKFSGALRLHHHIFLSSKDIAFV